LNEHHLIIRVGAGLIQFVYGSHSRMAADLTLDKNLFCGFSINLNCFGIEMVLCDLYLRTKGLLSGTFIITVWYKLYRCDHSVLEFNSFSPSMNWQTE